MLYYLWLRPNCCPLREERAAAKYKLKGKSEFELGLEAYRRYDIGFFFLLIIFSK